VASLGHERTRHQEAGHHDQGGDDEGAQEGSARRAESAFEARVNGLKADSEDGRPGDLDQEGLDDPEEEPAHEHDRAVEEEDIDSLAIGGRRHQTPRKGA
jgi:hypothetical protein